MKKKQALLPSSHQHSAGGSPSHFSLRSCHILQEASFYLKPETTTICAEESCALGQSHRRARRGAHQAETETPAVGSLQPVPKAPPSCSPALSPRCSCPWCAPDLLQERARVHTDTDTLPHTHTRATLLSLTRRVGVSDSLAN